MEKKRLALMMIRDTVEDGQIWARNMVYELESMLSLIEQGLEEVEEEEDASRVPTRDE